MSFSLTIARIPRITWKPKPFGRFLVRHPGRLFFGFMWLGLSVSARVEKV